MNRNTRFALLVVGIVLAVVAGIYFGLPTRTQAQAPVVIEKEVSRPITDVDCGKTYQFDQIKRFRVNGRILVNFHFGGKDRGRQPQYIADRNVIGQSTEMSRRVDRSLEYSTVTVLCLSDPSVEGHKVSNIELIKYELNLRRPLVPQREITNGGPAR